jgi:hypothetical protein
MTDRDDIKKRIFEDEDYIRAPKFSNSLTKFLAENDPEKIKPSQLAKLLSLTEEEIEQIYQEAIQELREEMTDDAD